MSLMKMSLSGAAMILIIIIVRAIALNKLPKKVFVLLWCVVLLRLLIPFSIPTMLSAYSLVGKNVPIQNAIDKVPVNNIILQVTNGQMDMHSDTTEVIQDDALSFSVWSAIWLTGFVICVVFFVVSYFRCYFEFRTSLPVRDEFAAKWLEEHHLKRSIQIRQSDRISAPLTYGILNPVILMPKKTDWAKRQQLQYVLMHEYIHICRFDMVLKLLAIFILCMHWFNPMVWVLYIFLNRDIELSCDESVVRQFGEASKSSYARTLITMEEQKSGWSPLCNNFSKNAIEERVTAIMKTRRITVWALLISVVLLAIIIVLFATSAEKETISTNDEIGVVAEGIDVPDVVLETAKQWVAQNTSQMMGQDDSNYSNWRIESLKPVKTYEDFEGMMLQIYQLNYELLADDPEKVTLAGGMTIDEEGWVVPTYADCTYMVFQQEGETLTYMTVLMENDCLPGDETFTNDLKEQLSSGD